MTATETAPATRVCPTLHDPETAIIRDENGRMTGQAERCSACRDWIPVVDPEFIHRRMSPDGRWKCSSCIREGTSYRMEPKAGPDYAFVPPLVPKIYATAELKDWPKQRQELKGWPDKFPWMIVGGITGSGKTRVSWAFVRALAAKRLTVLNLPCKEAHQRWATALTNSGRGDMERHWQQAPRIILDSLSDCIASEAWIGAIHRLLNVLMQSQTPILITTNVLKDDLHTQYGSNVARRLSQFKWVCLPNENRAEVLEKGE